MERIKLDLIIERGEEGIWGRVTYKKKLLTDSGKTVDELEEMLKALLLEFEGVDPEALQFNYVFEV